MNKHYGLGLGKFEIAFPALFQFQKKIKKIFEKHEKNEKCFVFAVEGQKKYLPDKEAGRANCPKKEKIK